jgi:hypothetical protein
MLHTRHRFILGGCGYHLHVATLALSALALFVVAACGGGAFAALHGLRAWRALRGIQRRVGAGMLEVTRGIEGVEARLGNAGESAARLERAGARLQESLAGLSVLAAAAGDARAALRVLAFLRR